MTRKRKFGFKGRGVMLFAPLSPHVLPARAASRIQSDPTPAAKAAAPSPPSWGERPWKVGLETWTEGQLPPGASLSPAWTQCQNWELCTERQMGSRQEDGNGAERWEDSRRKVRMEQRMGMCQQGHTAPCASPPTPRLPQTQALCPR